MGDELAAGGMLDGGDEADLDAELVGLVRLAFADALDLGRMQRINLAPALPTVLRQHPLGEIERLGEGVAQLLMAGGLAADVADDAAEIGPELRKARLARLARLNCLAWA